MWITSTSFLRTPNVLDQWLALLLPRSRVQISARRPAIMSEFLVVFPGPSSLMPGYYL
jgi:hypothetical protein